MKYKYIRFFREIGVDDVASVGGKGASLGEMYQALKDQGVRVPNGFAVTAGAYRYLLAGAGIEPALREALAGVRAGDVNTLTRAGAQARKLVYEAEFPDDLRQEILNSYKELKEEYGKNLTLAVRSSATAEDLPTASFAGQQETYLNVRNEDELIDTCRQCFASLFTDRAISYRAQRGFDHFEVALSITVMKMVRSDIGASGVMFSLDTESGFRDVVFINSAWGLGENIVQGAIEPDEFYVHKPTFEAGYRAVLRRRLGHKHLTMVYANGDADERVRNVETPADKQASYSITDEDVLTLADYAIKIERHYSERAGEPRPMDMEWAKDGEDGLIYMVQARPETVASQQEVNILKRYALKGKGTVLLSGRAVGSKIASGPVRVARDLSALADFQEGEVLVTETTTPDWEPVMKNAAAIVTNRGGRTCHAAIVARELGIPAIVGTSTATQVLQPGQKVTVSCAEGDTGNVYEGELEYAVERTDLTAMPRPNTRIMVNLGNPALAFKTALLPCDGVGLARLEFIINESIKAHPLALLHPDQVTDAGAREEINQLLAGYADGREFFIQRLSESVATIGAAFYPRPVVVRMSDFKSNEYAALIGGAPFEPKEENPMLGFRGASRYAHPRYAEAFELECAAMKRVRETMGLTNVILMIPFVRRVAEARSVIELMETFGLKRGDKNLQIYAMCEIPNNVLQIDEFSKYFDGFSIGSNDLTQLTLGVDRDSEIVAAAFDERDPGVKQLIRLAVEGCKRNGIHSGICGQAPSDYPEMARFLVEIGIESMSLNPDTVLGTTQQVLAIEKELGHPPRGK
ncbi:MAG: phosphoenolpyruvate synthase [Gammaproteobacteria bacterium]